MKLTTLIGLKNSCTPPESLRVPNQELGEHEPDHRECPEKLDEHSVVPPWLPRAAAQDRVDGRRVQRLVRPRRVDTQSGMSSTRRSKSELTVRVVDHWPWEDRWRLCHEPSENRPLECAAFKAEPGIVDLDVSA